jgi:hypothetical protein
MAKMVDAALRYAAAGWVIFPVPPGTKKSYKKASDYGGRPWGATKDIEEIKRDWAQWPNAGIGLPTGVINGVFVLDIDTPKGHAVDGFASLKQLEKQHGKLPATWMAETPTGGRHYFFTHPGKHVSVPPSQLGPGIDVKGDGGMVLVPPTRKPNIGEYKWIDQRTLASAPQWMLDKLTAEPREKVEYDDNPFLRINLPPIEDVREDIQLIPNNDCSWERWNHIGMMIYASTGGSDEGFTLFDEWSQQSSKYDAKKTKAKWKLLHTSPPTEITYGSLKHEADEVRDQQDEKQQEDSPSNIVQFQPHKDQREHQKQFSEKDDPVDILGQFPLPPMPQGLLPKAIEAYALDHASRMGCDPVGLAMGALAVCASVIPDSIAVQIKRHDNWSQPARVWVALVGGVSAMKSPIMDKVQEPLIRIDTQLAKQYGEARRAWEELPKEERGEKPIQERLILSDATPEASQPILADNPQGMIVIRDEMSGWFGSMEQYSKKGGGGSSSARSFWLTAYNGGPYVIDRVGRGSLRIENLSICVLGGIQPSAAQMISEAVVDDGLIQRMVPVVLGDTVYQEEDDDPPATPESRNYNSLIDRLFSQRYNTQTLTFSDEAQKIRKDVFRKNDELKKLETINPKLLGHFGKYNGLFARLCVLWHCIEHAHERLPPVITADVAQRVADFMHGFLRRHAFIFYFGTLGVSNKHSRIQAVASYILAHELTELTPRDIQRGDRAMRGLERREIDVVCDYLQSFDWLQRTVARRTNDVKWLVNPIVHLRYKDYAKKERKRREEAMRLIKESLTQRYENAEDGDNGDS